MSPIKKVSLGAAIGASVEFSPGKTDSVEKKQTSIDDLLNKKGFAEFLALHDNAEDILKDEARAQEVATVFEKKDKLIESARKSLSEQVSKEIGKERGLEFSKDELNEVNDHLSEMAVHDPKKFLELAEKSEKVEADQKEITALEKRLKALGDDPTKGVEADIIGNNKEKLEAKGEVLEKVKGGSFWQKLIVGYSGRKLEDLVAASNTYGLKMGVFGGYKNIDEQIELTQSLLELQGLKKELLAEVFPADVMGALMQQKVKEYFDQLTNAKQSFKELKKIQETMDRVTLASEKGDTGIDFLAQTDSTEVQAVLDEKFTATVQDSVDQAIVKSNLGNNALSNLESSLKEFIERESLGSRGKDEYKQFLTETLENQAQALAGGDNASKAKALLIRRIIIKINA